MEQNEFPILEYDDAAEAILEPGKVIEPIDAPEHCVICFFAEVIESLVENHDAKILAHSITQIGKHPLYEIDYDGQRLAFFHPGIGAPLAVGLLEETIARGCRKFMVCGGCGVLDRQVAVGHLLVPVNALRDEGTSYHYLPPSREIEMDPRAVVAIETVLQRHGLEYVKTKTWTTDAIYRETQRKTAVYREQGCLAVEMEASAFFAVAKFRDVQLGQILYGGDAVLQDAWDDRSWSSRDEIRRNLFWLAAEAAFEL
jgi:uridine phosphorylase